jgi:hypothetical protein
MIELSASAATTVGPPELNGRSQDRSFYFYGRGPTATMLGLREISERVQLELSTSTFRLQVGELETEAAYPKPNRSFVLMAPVQFLGKGAQPPIDDDDYAFFDE